MRMTVEMKKLDNSSVKAENQQAFILLPFILLEVEKRNLLQVGD